MKKFLFSILLAGGLPVFAGDLAVRHLDIDSSEIRSICPPGKKCIRGGTLLVVNFTYTCGETLGPVSFEKVVDGDVVHVFVSILAGQEVQPVSCRGLKKGAASVELPLVYNDVQVHVMK